MSDFTLATMSMSVLLEDGQPVASTHAANFGDLGFWRAVMDQVWVQAQVRRRQQEQTEVEEGAEANVPDSIDQPE